MGRGIVRGSSSFLFFGEEYGYGVPDWNYDENEFTVGARVSPGEANFPATNPEFTHITISDSTVSGFAAGGGDWIVVYSGSLDIPAGGTNRPGEADNDGIDIIQVFKTKTGSGARSDSNQYGYNSLTKPLRLMRTPCLVLPSGKATKSENWMVARMLQDSEQAEFMRHQEWSR